MIFRFFYHTGFRIIAAFSMIIILMMIIMIIVISSNNEVNRLNHKAIQSGNLQRALLEIRGHQNRARALVLEMTLIEDPAARKVIRGQIQEKSLQLDTLLNTVRNYYKDSSTENNMVNDLFRLISQYRENREQQFKLIDTGKSAEAQKIGSGVQAETYEKIRDIISEFERKESANLKQISLESDQAVHIAEKRILIVGISAIMISLIMSVMVLRLLRKIMREIIRGIQVLAESTTNILSTVTEVSTGAAETATAIAETTTTIEEVRQTAELSSEKANLVVETSQKAASIALQGKQSVLETIEGMRKISQQMMLITESVIKLSEQSRTIAEITTTVTDIADQSNLLAVNAAIEAAKAGELGRGFAVVAQEIRSLSEQSKQSTSQVKDILNDIQKSVNAAVQATENGNTVVETGSILSAQSGEVIQLMTDSVTEAAEAAIQISASSQQQKAGMEQLVPAMENIKLASEQSVIGNKQTQKAAQALDELGKNLKKIMERYKV